MKTLKQLTLAIIMLVSFGSYAQNDKDRELMADAQSAKEKLLNADPSLSSYFDNATGYVLFPNVGQAGFIIGGATGNGVVYENGTAIGMADLKKLNVGLQAGGQAIIQIIFFETEAALDRFKEGNFEFSADASAVAVKTGVAASANYDNGVVAFALPKAGLMADASIGGQKFSYTAFK